MSRSSSIKALQETLPALQKEIKTAKDKAESAQNKLNLLVQERDHIVKLLELHGYGETEPATPATGDLELTGASVRVSTPGFRDAVRTILLGAPEPLRPPEVARKLEAMNYPYTLKTPIATRIANELNRMSKTGLVEKIDQAYRVPSKAGEGTR